MITWFFIAYGTLCACIAVHYCLECKRLSRQQVWLRDVLRERDAAEREPTRIAFEAGYRVGLQVAADGDVEMENECGCEGCRDQRWMVN